MSLGIMIQPVDADTARHLPALASLLLPDVWADEIDLGDRSGRPTAPILRAVAHTLTRLSRYLHDSETVRRDAAACALLKGLAAQTRSLALGLRELANWIEQHPCPEQVLLDQLVAAGERARAEG